MAFYDNNQQQWAPAAGQASWEQQTPPVRSGASSVVPRDDGNAFAQQFEEVDRAVDNLFKSGKSFAGGPPRRESMPVGGGGPREFTQQFDPRMAGGPPRHGGSDFGGGDARTYSPSNLQSFYATQRHQPSRASEAEQVMQAKRRMAAQRERELRNYHQEQQYNRTEVSSFGGKPERAMSPGSGMNEEERRELIARQRSALYGEGPAGFEGAFDENGAPRPGPQSAGNVSARGHSPLAAGEQAPAGQPQPRSRANSTSSPSSNPPNFSVFDAAQQSSRTSTSSPGGSPPRAGKASGGSVAPIGTRPSGAAQAANPALNKRSTTPLPSPLSYGFAAGEESKANNGGDRATSAASNPSQEGGLAWGSSKNTVWGKNPLGAQASVWG